MAGLGEALGVLGIIEPTLKACIETYGLYKLTKSFGEDYQKAERGLRGQMARLKLLGDTRVNNLLAVPEDGTQLASTTLWTLQGMRNNFERCEMLMKKHGEPRTGKFWMEPPQFLSLIVSSSRQQIKFDSWTSPFALAFSGYTIYAHLSKHLYRDTFREEVQVSPLRTAEVIFVFRIISDTRYIKFPKRYYSITYDFSVKHKLAV
jgi:hypothetical protein